MNSLKKTAIVCSLILAASVSGCSYTADKNDNDTADTYESEVENTENNDTEDSEEEQFISIDSKEFGDGREVVLPTERRKIKHQEQHIVDKRDGIDADYLVIQDLDEFGNPICVTTIYDGEETNKEEYEIVDGKIVSSTTTGPVRDPVTTTYHYDENGDLKTSEANYDAGSGYETRIIEYGTDGALMSEKFYMGDDVVFSVDMKYNDDGDIIEEVYGGSMSEEHVTKYEYSDYVYEADNIARRQYVTENDKVKTIAEITYNEYMDPISVNTYYLVTYQRDWSDCIIYNNDKFKPYGETTYTYEYYEE